MSSRRHVVVVGGGISGLATAHRLLRDDADVDVTLLESSAVLGGKIATADLAGVAKE